MIPGDAAMKALAAVVTAVFAATILAGAPRKPANRLLALFLMLIAGNQAFETLRALAPDEAWALTWFRLASFCAALDPLALYLFVAAHQGPRRLLGGRTAWLLGGCAALLAFWALVVARLPDGVVPFVISLTLFTVAVYGGLVAVLARKLLERPDDAPLRFLVPALLIVSFPATLDAIELVVGVFGWYGYGGPDARTFFIGFACSVAFTALVLAGTALAKRRAHAARRPTWRLLLLSAVAGAVVAFVVRAYHFELILGHFTRGEREPVFMLVGRAGAALRWLLFGALVSTAVVRHDALGMSLAARRRAARALVALLVLTPAVLLLALPAALVDSSLVDVRPFDVVFLAAAVGLSQGFRALVDRVAHRVYGVPMPADVHGRHEAYRLAAMQAASEGRAAGRDGRLARLREELGLDAGTAEVLERLAEESAGGALAEGAWVAARYRVGPLLGAGAAARAFLAHDDLLDRPVVLKEVPTGPGDEHDVVLREARLAGSLQHPNVLVVHDVLRRRGFTVLVMEHAAGGSLATYLEQGPPPEPVARRMLDEILAGLAAVHAKGVVHRDLKPANVLRSAEGHVKLADFGIARLRVGATLDGSGPLVGTPEYMAPEQWRGEPATPATDVYAVGLLAKRLFGDAPPPDAARVIERALALRPEERWRDAGAMRDALRGHVQ